MSARPVTTRNPDLKLDLDRFRRALPTVVVAVGALAAAPACGPGMPNEPTYPLLVDATREKRLDFVHDCGPEQTYFLPEMMSPGVGLLDDDNDGDLDIYLTNGGPPPHVDWAGELPGNRLFRQQGDGTFEEATEESGLGDDGYGYGLGVGDYDNDGDVDVFVTNYGANRLFRNRGDGVYDDVTDEAGIHGRHWSSSTCFIDYDRDGWLDLYVTNYLQYDPWEDCPAPTGQPEFCPPAMFDGTEDRLYRNRGDGTFEDVSRTSGIAGVAMKGLGVVCADLTGDGWVDFFVSNDQENNNLWVNLGDGRFRDDGIVAGVAFNESGGTEASMGIALADLDGDARLDLYVTHLRGESNTAYVNEGGGVFHDATAALALHAPTLRFTGFGVAAADLEHDRDVDLLVVNGHVFRAEPEPDAALGDFWNEYGQPGLVLRNEGSSGFADVSGEVGDFGTVPQVGRSVASGDIDNDGDIDFVVANSNGPAQIFVNESPKRGRWLMLRAWDGARQRDAPGTMITVVADGQRQVRMAGSAMGYLASNDPRVHFGLGDVSRIDAIEVLWPDGKRERFDDPGLDRHVRLVRGTGEPLER